MKEVTGEEERDISCRGGDGWERGRKSVISLEGSQDSPARPSDGSSM